MTAPVSSQRPRETDEGYRMRIADTQGNKAQHSPLPWRFDKPNCIVAALSTKKEAREKCSTVKIADVYETQFDLSEPETLDANAALIVRAVNHADKLAEALRDSLNGIDILEARQTLKAYDEAAQ